ncbi:MAG: hypothetical protein AB8B55_12720 [Mariniblastus sp.]
MNKTSSITNLLCRLTALLLTAGLFPELGICQTATKVTYKAETESDSVREIRVEGLVTELKKYSMTVQANGKTHQVKLANGAPIGLRMSQPWYDWKNDQVVVDAFNFPNAAGESEPKVVKRVALKLPSEKLFLISRFADVEQMSKTMATNVKRINFYLITPKDPGAHLPTEEEPFIAGELAVQKNGQTRLKVNDQTMPVRLGFRYATMNGFSITALEPNKTQVFLSGIQGENEGEIIASRILFQPVRIKSK